MFLSGGLLLMLVGCASFDTSYTDPAELEKSQWGAITKREYSGYSGLPYLPPSPVNQKNLEERLLREVDAFRFNTPCPGQAFPR